MRFLPVTVMLLTIFLSSPLLARDVKGGYYSAPIDDVRESFEDRSPLTRRLSERFANMSKEKKALYLNLAGTTGILAHAVLVWGASPARYFKTTSEGWFDADTGYGGADKLGHFYTGYVVGDIFSYAYDSWGFDRRKSSIFSFLSSVLCTTLGEIADGFSDYGLSHEDIIANVSGAAASYVLHENPWLSDKIDLRLEYKLSGFSLSTTDYDQMKYLIALKAEGFDWIKNEQLKFAELYFGYYTRGFVNDEPSRERIPYLGIGFNLSRFFRNKNKPLSTLFTYYQLPYSYLEAGRPMTSRH
ncbi:MAG: YfiM family protein [Desulfobacterales bacterium]|nr:YfiM family protein [Desulfobacterales bacterium]